MTYSFAAGSPGTYLYESGSDISKQIEMGLYGALVVRPTLGANFAYDAHDRSSTRRASTCCCSARSTPTCTTRSRPAAPTTSPPLHNRYFAVNGREFPDTLQDNGSALLPTQPYGALVRIQPNNARAASRR